MRTPAGKECSYFYGDYYRGRNIEECRLLKDSNPPQTWKPGLCNTCPVPDIQMANGCQHMVLDGKITRLFFVGKSQVQVRAFCNKSNQPVAEPHIGCGQCHTLPPIFFGELPRDTDPVD